MRESILLYKFIVIKHNENNVAHESILEHKKGDSI